MDPGRAPIAEDLPYELVGERERPGAKEPLDARRRPRRRFGPSTRHESAQNEKLLDRDPVVASEVLQRRRGRLLAVGLSEHHEGQI